MHVFQIKAIMISISFSLAFGAMFAKTWRVHVIFTQTTIGKKVCWFEGMWWDLSYFIPDIYPSVFNSTP